MSPREWRSMGWVCTLALVFGLGTPRVAWADCPPEWLPGEGVLGLDGEVYAMTTWDPDGPGGQPELLVVGGYFSIAGNVFANNIAAWDGTTWQPLGSGMNDSVYALTVYNGELIAGGWFTTAGGNWASNIARWNGATWQPLGSGMDGYVSALTVYPPLAGELIAGGWFTTAGGEPASYIARWDGATWQPLGSGMGGGGYYPDVYALTVYNGELIAGGNFTTAGGEVSAYWARWDCPYRRGDLDCNGAVDFRDINPFVLALSNPGAYAQTYPDCDILIGDMNCDASVDFGDINPFVACLSNGDCDCP
jgi:hypothetical protein